MSFLNLTAASRLRTLLPSLTDIMVDCCDDVRTTVVVARVTKLVKAHIDILENPSAPRSLQPNSSAASGSSNQSAVGINFAEHQRRYWPGLVTPFPGTGLSKRKAGDSSSSSSSSEGSYECISDEEDDVTHPPKKHRSPLKAAMDRLVNEVLIGRNDGICATDDCSDPVYARGFCHGCFRAWFRELCEDAQKN